MLSLIIPVYKNEDSLPDLLEQLQGLHRELEDTLEVVFVVDGSPDNSYAILQERLPTTGLRATLVSLTRNFGSFAAVRMGLQHASGEFFAVMAADLQEPPELVLQMHSRLRAGDVDVVIAERMARDDPLLSRWQSQIFWALYRRYVVPDMPEGGVDVFACNRPFRDALLGLEERRSSLIAQIFWLGFRRASVPYVRQARRYGKSAWTWRKKVSYLADSVFAFSGLPLHLLLQTGFYGIVMTLVLGGATLFGRLMELFAVPGYTMTLLVVLFFGSLNLFSLGIVGTYTWRAYENTKQRPQAIAQAVQHFGDAV